MNGSILNRYVTGPGGDEPLTRYSSAGTSSRGWYAADNAGSVIATADQNANATATYDYGPYGEPITPSGATAWGGSRYRYTGQIEIPGAQVYDYKARVYDPGMGRFYQTDPIGYSGDANIYAYACNDPINLTDPTGLMIFGTTINGITVICDTHGAATMALGDTDDYWYSGGTIDTFAGNYSSGPSGGGDGGPSIGLGGGVSGGSGDAGGGGGKTPGPQNTVSEVVVTAKMRSQGIDLSKLGSCLGGSALDYYGLTGAAGVSGLLAIPIPKSIVPPFRSIGTPTTNLFSVLGHYVDIRVPAVTIAGRTSTNLFRIAGSVNPYVAAGLFAVDAAVISYNTYQCYNEQ